MLLLLFNQVSASQTLTPALFVNSNTFYSPTVAPGPVTVRPSLFVDADTFYSATVAPGAIVLHPSLYSDADTFFPPTVSVASPQNLSPSLYVDPDTFFPPTVRSGGGGTSFRKTGLEPVKKRPQAPPEPVRIPTYVLPKFAPKLAPRAPRAARNPFDRAPDLMPLDLTKMKQEIWSAQDEADIKAVLDFIDSVD